MRERLYTALKKEANALIPGLKNSIGPQISLRLHPTPSSGFAPFCQLHPSRFLQKKGCSTWERSQRECARCRCCCIRGIWHLAQVIWERTWRNSLAVKTCVNLTQFSISFIRRQLSCWRSLPSEMRLECSKLINEDIHFKISVTKLNLNVIQNNSIIQNNQK